MLTGLSSLSLDQFVPVIVTRVPPYIDPVYGEIEETSEPTANLNPAVSMRPYLE